MSETSSGPLEIDLEDYSDSFESGDGAGVDIVSREDSIAGDDTGGAIKITTDNAGSNISTSKKPRASNIRFKQVASTVQNLQFATQAFKTSREIRDMVHKEWLAGKEARKLKENEHRKSERRKEELENVEKRKGEV